VVERRAHDWEVMGSIHHLRFSLLVELRGGCFVAASELPQKDFCGDLDNNNRISSVTNLIQEGPRNINCINS
jgi:hypothetical protein